MSHTRLLFWNVRAETSVTPGSFTVPAVRRVSGVNRLLSIVSFFHLNPGPFLSVMAAAVRLLPAVTFALLSCFPAAVSSRREVLELGDADFDYLATEHETMLVKFYAPW